MPVTIGETAPVNTDRRLKMTYNLSTMQRTLFSTLAGFTFSALCIAAAIGPAVSLA